MKYIIRYLYYYIAFKDSGLKILEFMVRLYKNYV